MTPRERIERLANDLGYTLDEIRSPSRVKPLVDARSALAVHLKEQGRNKTHIGKLINRDRTSVLNLLRRVS